MDRVVELLLWALAGICVVAAGWIRGGDGDETLSTVLFVAFFPLGLAAYMWRDHRRSADPRHSHDVHDDDAT